MTSLAVEWVGAREKLAVTSVREWYPERGGGLVLHINGEEKGPWCFLSVVMREREVLRMIQRSLT